MNSTTPRSAPLTKQRVLDDLHEAEIELLNQLMGILPTSEDQVIDEWLDRLEGHTIHHFAEEEAQMKRINYPNLVEHSQAHSHSLSHLRSARRDWEKDRDLMQLWHFLERDYFDWFERHVYHYDLAFATYLQQLQQSQ